MYDEEKIFGYLVELRDSGIINMHKSVPYLMHTFNMDINEARQWLGDWINSFNSPNCKNCD